MDKDSASGSVARLAAYFSSTKERRGQLKLKAEYALRHKRFTSQLRRRELSREDLIPELLKREISAGARRAEADPRRLADINMPLTSSPKRFTSISKSPLRNCSPPSSKPALLPSMKMYAANLVLERVYCTRGRNRLKLRKKTPPLVPTPLRSRPSEALLTPVLSSKSTRRTAATRPSLSDIRL